MASFVDLPQELILKVLQNLVDDLGGGHTPAAASLLSISTVNKTFLSLCWTVVFYRRGEIYFGEDDDVRTRRWLTERVWAGLRGCGGAGTEQALLVAAVDRFVALCDEYRDLDDEDNKSSAEYKNLIAMAARARLFELRIRRESWSDHVSEDQEALVFRLSAMVGVSNGPTDCIGPLLEVGEGEETADWDLEIARSWAIAHCRPAGLKKLLQLAAGRGELPWAIMASEIVSSCRGEWLTTFLNIVVRFVSSRAAAAEDREGLIFALRHEIISALSRHDIAAATRILQAVPSGEAPSWFGSLYYDQDALTCITSQRGRTWIGLLVKSGDWEGGEGLGSLAEAAAESGRIDILSLLPSNCVRGWGPEAATAAADQYNISILCWLRWRRGYHQPRHVPLLGYCFSRVGNRFGWPRLLRLVRCCHELGFLNPNETHGSWTILAQAARVGNVSLVKFLLDCGADPARGWKDSTPLHAAASHRTRGSLPIVAALLAAGARMTGGPGTDFMDPLTCAKTWGNLDVAVYLEESLAGGSRRRSLRQARRA